MSIKNIAKANSNAKKVDALSKSNKNKTIYGAATTGTSIAAIAAGAITARHYRKKYYETKEAGIDTVEAQIKEDFKQDATLICIKLSRDNDDDYCDAYIDAQMARFDAAYKALKEERDKAIEEATPKGIKKLNPFKKKVIKTAIEVTITPETAEEYQKRLADEAKTDKQPPVDTDKTDKTTDKKDESTDKTTDKPADNDAKDADAK